MHQLRKLERLKAMKDLHSLDTYLDARKQLEGEKLTLHKEDYRAITKE